MPWTPGASGNPKGRPPKSRALTELLKTAGRSRVDYNGKKRGRQQVLSEMLWEAALTGKVTFPDEREVHLATDDWFGIAKFLYTQIDGPPKVGLFDVPEDTTVAINFVKVEGRKPTAPEGEAEPTEA